MWDHAGMLDKSRKALATEATRMRNGSLRSSA